MSRPKAYNSFRAESTLVPVCSAYIFLMLDKIKSIGPEGCVLFS